MNSFERREPLDDLEVMKILYEEHHKHLFPFIRLLIVLSVAFITLLASPGNKTPSSFLKASVFCHLISLFCGVVVLHQAVQAPLRQLRRYVERRKSEGTVLSGLRPGFGALHRSLTHVSLTQGNPSILLRLDSPRCL